MKIHINLSMDFWGKLSKMKTKVYLGLDTSCYSTSIAAVDINKNIIFNKTILLDVKAGEKGLRQSDAIFKHIKNFTTIVDKQNIEILAVCASQKPRDVKDSYMPVFMVSDSIGLLIANLVGAKYIPYSHQENHISAVYNHLNLNQDNFLGVHLSGGTTEILKCSKHDYKYSTDIISATMDISAGQLLDRLAVSMGYSFPGGKYIDDLASKVSNVKELSEIKKRINLNISLKEYGFHFSGIETKLKKYIDIYSNEVISKLAIDIIGETLVQGIKKMNCYIDSSIIFFGGVASSKVLREYILNNETFINTTIHFAPSYISSDNALGCAFAANEYMKGNYNEN